jgi:hypothetical protein
MVLLSENDQKYNDLTLSPSRKAKKNWINAKRLIIQFLKDIRDQTLRYQLTRFIELDFNKIIALKPDSAPPRQHLSSNSIEPTVGGDSWSITNESTSFNNLHELTNKLSKLNKQKIRFDLELYHELSLLERLWSFPIVKHGKSRVAVSARAATKNQHNCKTFGCTRSRIVGQKIKAINSIFFEQAMDSSFNVKTCQLSSNVPVQLARSICKKTFLLCQRTNSVASSSSPSSTSYYNNNASGASNNNDDDNNTVSITNCIIDSDASDLLRLFHEVRTFLDYLMILYKQFTRLTVFRGAKFSLPPIVTDRNENTFVNQTDEVPLARIRCEDFEIQPIVAKTAKNVKETKLLISMNKVICQHFVYIGNSSSSININRTKRISILQNNNPPFDNKAMVGSSEIDLTNTINNINNNRNKMIETDNHSMSRSKTDINLNEKNLLNSEFRKDKNYSSLSICTKNKSRIMNRSKKMIPINLVQSFDQQRSYSSNRSKSVASSINLTRKFDNLSQFYNCYNKQVEKIKRNMPLPLNVNSNKRVENDNNIYKNDLMTLMQVKSIVLRMK